MAAQPAPKLRKEIQNQLSKAGLSDVKVAPEEYVVHAKDKNGNPVMMVVTPSSFLEMTDVKVGNPDNIQARRSDVGPDPTALAKQ